MREISYLKYGPVKVFVFICFSKKKNRMLLVFVKCNLNPKLQILDMQTMNLG